MEFVAEFLDTASLVPVPSGTVSTQQTHTVEIECASCCSPMASLTTRIRRLASWVRQDMEYGAIRETCHCSIDDCAQLLGFNGPTDSFENNHLRRRGAYERRYPGPRAKKWENGTCTSTWRYMMAVDNLERDAHALRLGREEKKERCKLTHRYPLHTASTELRVTL
ncbi:hypothetical protein BJ508DRAFT_378002 [Ascobolus immersus RN42]|uniref:Uncharacterized protein n=1 Tax=Ascobolus immersus RN42 TaxID=1160509 RepID=A0A3N4I0D8_ASCIM|nr:hypothetical protein BJ508DRAFT_378002 [Ascobolus immersus RN42]